MQSKASQLERGALIGGYRIDELISRGGMGVVYRATNIALNRSYALKVLAPELAEDEHYRERFRREIRLAASLHHPNVVAVHYAGEHEGSLFVVMDYIEGSDLRELLVKNGALQPRHAVDILTQVCSALDAAHEKGLVHRDVKPANVLISSAQDEEHAYLTDFGLAKRSNVLTALTATGLIAGTVDYMAPEQIRGGETDARTDIYAVGCVFFQMLTGNVPYTRDNSMAVLFAHVHDDPPPLAGSLAELYPAFGRVIETAMAKEPRERYQSAGDFARDAAAALVGMRSDSAPISVATGDAQPADTIGPGAADTIGPGAADTIGPGAADTVAAGPAATGEPTRQPSGEPTVLRQATSAPTEAENATESHPAPVASPGAGKQTRVGEPRPVVPPPAAASSPTSPSPQRRPSSPPQRPPASPSPEALSSQQPPHDLGRPRRWYLYPALALLVTVVVVVVVVVVASSGGSSSPGQSGQSFSAVAAPVPTNRVTGSGSATIALNGDAATVTVHTRGLLNGSPHLMHIHAGGIGACPPASAARLHNGNLAISTGNGISYYGPTQVSLTEYGSTSGAVPNNIQLYRYPADGSINYTRVVSITPALARLIREGNAVIVVHGIDYNHNGIYDFQALGVSDLDKTLTGEATAPALCGAFKAVTTASNRGTPRVTFVASLVPYNPIDSAQIKDPVSGRVRVTTRLLFVCHLPAVSVRQEAGQRSADTAPAPSGGGVA